MVLSEQQKSSYLEEFSNVMALYTTVTAKPERLLIKNSKYPDDMDFMLDVELKTKRTLLNGSLYEMFLRLASKEEHELLSEPMRLALGITYREYRLGIDGPYASLYFKTKNDQIRGSLQGALDGDDRDGELSGSEA